MTQVLATVFHLDQYSAELRLLSYWVENPRWPSLQPTCLLSTLSCEISGFFYRGSIFGSPKMKLFRRVDGKLSRKGNKGHFWRVSSVTLLYTPPVKLPVPAQDVLQQLCWKINKLYMKFAGLHLFVFYFTVYLLRLFCPVIGDAVDDRTWLEVRPSDVTLTVFTLSFPHSHHCHPDTLDSLREPMVHSGGKLKHRDKAGRWWRQNHVWPPQGRFSIV